jgi:hypothetical protein
MRLDHLSYAAGPDGLDATARRLGELLGADFVEVVGALDHPAVDEVPFGQAVKARTESGGGWLGWVVAVDDLAPVEARLGRPAAPGHRTRPDGVELNWHQLGVRGLMNDPQLPFFVRWESDPADHPSQGDTAVELQSLAIAGDPRRVADWLGVPAEHPLEDVGVSWIAPNGQPGLLSATFRTPNGEVTL